MRDTKQNSDTNFVFLLGAGASISSGIPSATDCIWEWKKEIYISENMMIMNQDIDFNTPKTRKNVQEWLDQAGEYPRLDDISEYSFYADVPINDFNAANIKGSVTIDTLLYSKSAKGI